MSCSSSLESDYVPRVSGSSIPDSLYNITYPNPRPYCAAPGFARNKKGDCVNMYNVSTQLQKSSSAVSDPCPYGHIFLNNECYSTLSAPVSCTSNSMPINGQCVAISPPRKILSCL